MKLAYPETNSKTRSAVIESVMAYRWPDNDNTDKERLTARKQFDWLRWLHDADPNCPLAKQALDDVLVNYPNFRPRKHPDFTRWINSGWVGHQSPWTVEDLLTKSPAEWLPELLSFQATDILGPDREGLVITIKETVKRQFEWGIELATALEDAGKWNADLWYGMIHAWSEIYLDEERYKEVLQWLSRTELYCEHARTIADSLSAFLRNETKPYALSMLSQANEIAEALWRHLDRTTLSERSSDWIQMAINHPAGILTEFWLGSLSHWRRHQDPIPKTLSEEYFRVLTNIMQDQSLPGKLGRSILFSRFAYLLEVDEEWTRNNLLPLFDPDNDLEEFQIAWDGYLISGYLNPTIVELLSKYTLKALRRINDELSGNRNRFIEYYTILLGYYVEDPLKTWITELFLYCSIEDRLHFSWIVQRELRRMRESKRQEWWQRWLKSYWENRINGKPATLESGEVERMLDWLPHLGSEFPEAVDHATRKQLPPLQQSSIIYDLSKSELAKQYPEDVAKLMINLGNSNSHLIIWYKGDELIDIILQSDLPQAIEHQLKELVARLGLKQGI